MAGSPSFLKRQKERARQEKQAEKLRKKADRRQSERSAPSNEDQQVGGPIITHDENGQPRELDFNDFK
jgi:hypothetical protein